MKVIIPLICVALAVSACTKRINYHPFEGEYYKTKAKAVDRGNKKEFVVTVNDVEKGVEGAIASGAYQATKHCLRFYGTSDIAWTVGPDTPPEQLGLEDGVLTLSGKCVEK